MFEGDSQQINGRERETATFLKALRVKFYVVASGFAPRHLNRCASACMSANGFRELMQNLYIAHQDFKKAWAMQHRSKSKDKKPSEVDLTRNKFCDELNLLFQTKLDPLRQAFLTGSVAAVDDVIDFLAVDIPAFRCGYEKEWYLRRLKSLPLTEAQQERLKTIALDLCRKPDYRREFSDWAKLMITLADETFVDELQSLLESSDEFVRKKVKRMLAVIVQNRKDLKAKRLASM